MSDVGIMTGFGTALALGLQAVFFIASFLIGSIPFGLVISKVFFRRDIRTEGSGNIGAANALRTLGRGGAIAVLVLDACKGALPVVAARGLADVFGPESAAYLPAAGALCAILGHCFSPFLKFRGGKGVATNFGAVIALAWPAGIVFALVWLAAVAAAGFSSLGSMLACAAMSPALWILIGPAGGVFGIVSALVIIVLHRANIARLRTGTESVLPLFGRGKSNA